MFPPRWQPFGDLRAEMDRLRNEMDKLFGRFDWGGGRKYVAGASYPALNLWEDEDAFYVETEIPGLELNDLEIYVSGGNQLSIKGERKRPSPEKGGWHRQERGYGAFARVFDLPANVNAENVEAHLKHGVLTIRLPKSEEARPRRISVKAD
jgi:HSP20 family protein